MSDDERVCRPAEILERYARGERDFRGLEITEDASGSFRGAVLEGADFSEAFMLADLSGANLRATRFVEANVKTCRFDGADLRGADFTRAPIDAATFDGANLEGATFEGAGCYSHTFAKGELPT